MYLKGPHPPSKIAEISDFYLTGDITNKEEVGALSILFLFGKWNKCISKSESIMY